MTRRRSVRRSEGRRRRGGWVLIAVLCLLLSACGKKGDLTEAGGEPFPLAYATQFSLETYEDGSRLLTIEGEEQRFLLLPEGGTAPEELPAGTAVLRLPLRQIYLASSSAMDLFDRAGALSSVTMTSTRPEDWTLPKIQSLVREDEILYVGRYDAPDYEVILDGDCGLAIENTMITHSPETKEKLTQLGVPVLVEHSSYEPHPLGRVEWVRLFGILTGHEAEAEAFFQEVRIQAESYQAEEPTGKTVVFCYVTQTGQVNVRTQDDYVAELIRLAGGTYLFPGGAEASGRSQVGMDPETFYAGAVDADILIYNGTIDGGVATMEELLKKSPVFSDIKAVREGRAYCAEASLFQASGAVAEVLTDLRNVVHGEDTELSFFRCLE